MTFTETILQTYKDKYIRVEGSLKLVDNLFPDTSNPTKKLDNGYTFILQMIFGLRIGFLEEFNVLFSYAYSKSKMEKANMELEKMGYITCQYDRQMGKIFTLTKQALYYIYTTKEEREQGAMPPFTFSQDAFPKSNRLMYYKCLNGFYARYFFNILTSLVQSRYNKEDANFRREYTKEQFINQYLFPEVRDKGWSKALAKEFYNQSVDKLNDVESPEYKQFHAFIKAYKEAASQQTIQALLLKGAFLKDYTNQIMDGKDNAIRLMRQIMDSSPNNVLRENPYHFWNRLYSYTKSKNLQYDSMRFYNDEALRYFKLQHHSLLNSKVERPKEEQNLILKHITELETQVRKCELNTTQYNDFFECSVFKGYNENDIATFDTLPVTMDTLKNQSIFITNVTSRPEEKPLITFSIILNSNDDLPTSTLFGKLEKIYLYSLKNLASFDYQINIYTYRQTEIDVLKEKLKVVNAQFKELGCYGLLLPKLQEMQLISTEVHPRERHEHFKALKKYYHF